nr:recombinase family protein [Novosphingobium panipatense]
MEAHIQAWIYCRFSTDKQADGYSIERQLTYGRDYVERMGWDHSVDRELKDEGRSAFHGGNRLEGAALHEFEAKARSGAFKDTPTVLCVENIDRLSRQGAKAAAQLIWMLNENGVSVATWHDSHVYKAGDDTDMMDLFSIIIKGQLAHEESLKKSKRSNANWAKKREEIRTTSHKEVITGTPAWIDVDPVTKMMALNEYRVSLLNEIFDLYVSGLGVTKIVKQLNARNEPTWCVSYRDNKRGWGETYIHKLLQWRACLGEKYEGRDDTGELLNAHYFPQAVNADKFNQAQSVRAGKARSGGPTRFTANNLLSGIAKCEECGSPVRFIRKGADTSQYVTKSGEVRTYHRKVTSYLQCDGARRKHDCTNSTQLPYEPLEKTILEGLLPSIVQQKTVNHTVVGMRQQIAEMERLRAASQGKLDNIVSAIEAGGALTFIQRAGELEKVIAEQTEQIDSLVKKLALEESKPSSADDGEMIMSLQTKLTSSDEDERIATRCQVNAALKRLINRVDVEATNTARIWISDKEWYWFDADGVMLEAEQRI